MKIWKYFIFALCTFGVLAAAQPGAVNNPLQAVLYSPQSLTPPQRAQALTNLGLSGGAPVSSSELIGDVKLNPNTSDYGKWLLANGRPLSRTTYATLFNAYTRDIGLITTSGSTAADVTPATAALVTLGASLEGGNVVPGTTFSVVSSGGGQTIDGSVTVGSNIMAVRAATDNNILNAALLNTAISGANVAANARLTAAFNASIGLNLGQVTTQTGLPFLAGTVSLDNMVIDANRRFIGPASALGLTDEPRALARNFPSQTFNTQGVATTTTPNVLFARSMAAPPNTNQFCFNIGSGASNGFATCNTTSFFSPASTLTTSNGWTNSSGNQIVPQSCTSANDTVGLAAAAGTTAIQINKASVAADYGTAPYLQSGDFIRIGDYGYVVGSNNMAGTTAANYTVTLNAPLQVALTVGQAITCVGRAVNYPLAAPTITTQTIGTFSAGSSIVIGVSSAADFIIGDFLTVVAGPTWGCVITAISGNNVTCTVSPTSTANSANANGQLLKRGWRLTVRQPSAASSAPPVNTSLGNLDWGSTTLLSQNVAADINNVSVTAFSFRQGGTITLNTAPTGTTGLAGAQSAPYTLTSRITLSAAATATGTATVKQFAFGRGNGSTTFNIPDLRGRILAAAGFNGTTTNSIGQNFTVPTGAGAAVAVPGNPFIYAGP